MMKHFLFVLALAFAAAGPAAHAQSFQEGVDYMVIKKPIQTDNPAQVEVVEFFWYGCPHCYKFEPVINPWVKKLPKDAHFRRIPAMFNEEYAQGARAFYALEAIGVEERLHKALFDAIHTGSRLRVADEAALTEWLSKQGVDTKKFAAAYRSFAVEGKLKRAAQLTQGYKIEGVPSMAVNGKYVVITNNITSFEHLLKIADFLIEKSRGSGAKAASKK
jgi:thiol:disulfide interchange protein DsbA